MSYKASSGISIAEWHEIQKLVDDLSKVVNQKLDAIGADTVATLRNNVTALQIAVTAINSEQGLQNSRLDDLESTAANTEFTTTEIQQIWGA